LQRGGGCYFATRDEEGMEVNGMATFCKGKGGWGREERGRVGRKISGKGLRVSGRLWKGAEVGA